ncbi:hypothetical protein [Microbacterium sp.]|uniref:hypothetical protein n=1 Tax=Microbacterium sp. TaxID=51671 RepID=UPI002810C2B6|nr:hypothetical protein [Microbacterium sp.]
MSVLQRSQTVDVGGGRGRLAPDHAASLRRVDAEVRALIGRDLDINSAWRDPATQQKLREAYEHYLRYGAPWAPIALEPDDSVHCKGGAIDTDDHRDPRIVRILNRHGWRQTVYRNGRLVEEWHFERFANRDQHRFDPDPAATDPEEEDMFPVIYAKPSNAGTVYEIKNGRKRGITAVEWALIKAAYAAAGQKVPYARGRVTAEQLRGIPNA